jgi:hypothetical protein
MAQAHPGAQRWVGSDQVGTTGTRFWHKLGVGGGSAGMMGRNGRLFYKSGS